MALRDARAGLGSAAADADKFLLLGVRRRALLVGLFYFIGSLLSMRLHHAKMRDARRERSRKDYLSVKNPRKKVTREYENKIEKVSQLCETSRIAPGQENQEARATA